MMSGQQVIDTTRSGQQPSQQAAYWVAGFMLAGIAGLAVIGLIFRKHVEL